MLYSVLFDCGDVDGHMMTRGVMTVTMPWCRSLACSDQCTACSLSAPLPNAVSVPVIGAVLLVMLQTVYSTGAPTVPRPLQNRRAADLIEAMRREIACEDALRHRMKRHSNAGGPCQLSDLMTACSEPRSARSCIMIHTHPVNRLM